MPAGDADMKLDLTEDERRILLRLVRDAIDASRFPLSPETDALACSRRSCGASGRLTGEMPREVAVEW